MATPKDISKAAFWLEKAAAQNDPADQFALALHYQRAGIGKNFQKEAFWWRKAANNGIAEAQYQLGVTYLVGSGLPKADYMKALYWFERADLQGHGEAPYEMARMYDAGKGVKQDLAEGTRWMCRAGKRQNTNAIFSLRNKSVECLTEIAQQGNPYAQHQLGGWYENAGGDKHDYENAAVWYRKAAEQGLSGAFFALGDLYARGRGVPQDPVLAKMLYILDGEGQYGRDHSSRIQSPLSPAQVDSARSAAKEWKVGTPLPTKLDR